MQTLALALNAMATRFEILVQGDNPVALRAAAEEALNEIERLDSQLSLYRPTSEMSWINARAASEPVRVEPELFRLLQRAQRLHAESGGVFDVTIAPLVRCWGFMGGTGQMPEPEQIAKARSEVGMHLVLLKEEDFTIRFAKKGVMIDLGSIGKGYALERAADVLMDAGVTSALLHGGTSTVYALGCPSPDETWKVAIDSPPDAAEPLRQANLRRSGGEQKGSLAVVSLQDEALSVSGVHGRSFIMGDKRYGHVIDPRTGEPVQGALLAAVALPSATETDALSTALLALGSSGHESIASLRPDMRTLLLTRMENSEDLKLESKGILKV